MNIQDLKSNTTWQEASNTINNNNNKISLAIATLENAKLKNKGYFTSVEKLNEAVPNPTIGSKAYVGTSEPYAIYIVENGVWVDSGYTGGDEIVAKITTDRIEYGAITSEKIATSAFDNTLSVSGKIAPADVVGGKLSKLDEEVFGMNEHYKTQINTTSATYLRPTTKAEINVEQGTYNLSVALNGIFSSGTLYFYDSNGEGVDVKLQNGTYVNKVTIASIPSINPVVVENPIGKVGLYCDNKTTDGAIDIEFDSIVKELGLKEMITNETKRAEDAELELSKIVASLKDDIIENNVVIDNDSIYEVPNNDTYVPISKLKIGEHYKITFTSANYNSGNFTAIKARVGTGGSMQNISTGVPNNTEFVVEDFVPEFEFTTILAAQVSSYIYNGQENIRIKIEHTEKVNKIDTIKKDVANLAEKGDVTTTFDPLVSWAKGFVGKNGQVRTGGSYDNYSYSGKFDVRTGDVVIAKFRAYCCYDSNDTPMTSSGSDNYTDMEMVVPEGVSFMTATVTNNLLRVIIKRKEENKSVVYSKRKEIYINLADNEETIYVKMLTALHQRDTDVYFERGTYTFTQELFDKMKNVYGQVQVELPVGGNCRYFFNGSTLKTMLTYDDSNPINLMGSIRMDSNFELHDGYLYAEGVRYVFHDETSGSPYQYKRLYKNMHFSRRWARPNDNTLEKIIGGGMGQWGIVEFDGCTFKADSYVKPLLTYHGSTYDITGEYSNFECVIKNCLVDGGIDFYSLKEKQYVHIVICGSKYKSLGNFANLDRVTYDGYCNEIVV